ncbi:MAG: LacI family DNA-binding transcriptional regulator [Cellulosilyticaceae bacterium]
MSSLNIKDIAKICGVGVSTVSRAINGHTDVNAETKARILEVIKTYNYVPNNSARNLRRLPTRTIAVLVKGIANPFFSPLIKILEHEIHKRSCTMMIHHVDAHADEVDTATTLIREKNLLGILFVGGKFSHHSQKLQNLDVPFVMCTSWASEADTDSYSSVCIDDFKESYKAVDYLCRLGHTHIAILLPQQDESIGKRRFEGYKQALKDHGIAPNPNLIHYFHTDIEDYSLHNGYLCTKELLDSEQHFTALVALSDILAIGASKAILEKGYTIPHDYSIIGFDGIELSEYCNPPLTTISQPIQEMALESIRILFDLIDSHNTTPRVHTLFEATLIERQSCSIPHL